MAKPQSAKHTRSNSIVYVDTAAPPPEEISHRVQELNPRSIANILACAARIHPDVMYMVDRAIHATQEGKRTKLYLQLRPRFE